MKNSIKLLTILCLSAYGMLGAAEKKASRSLFKPMSQQRNFSLADKSLLAETSVDSEDSDDNGATGTDDALDYNMFVPRLESSPESSYMSLHELGLGAPPKVAPRITSPQADSSPEETAASDFSESPLPISRNRAEASLSSPSLSPKKILDTRADRIRRDDEGIQGNINALKAMSKNMTDPEVIAVLEYQIREIERKYNEKCERRSESRMSGRFSGTLEKAQSSLSLNSSSPASPSLVGRRSSQVSPVIQNAQEYINTRIQKYTTELESFRELHVFEISQCDSIINELYNRVEVYLKDLLDIKSAIVGRSSLDPATKLRIKELLNVTDNAIKQVKRDISLLVETPGQLIEKIDECLSSMNVSLDCEEYEKVQSNKKIKKLIKSLKKLKVSVKKLNEHWVEAFCNKPQQQELQSLNRKYVGFEQLLRCKEDMILNRN